MRKVKWIFFAYMALVALVLFTLISLGLGVVARFAERKGSFLEKYFLGGRSLGAIAVRAITRHHGGFPVYLSPSKAAEYHLPRFRRCHRRH